MKWWGCGAVTNYFQTFTCGHSGSYSMSTKVTANERTHILQRVFGKPCDSCRGGASKPAETVHALNDVLKLPALLGSEGQIRWAEQIRLTMYEHVMSQQALVSRLQFLTHIQMIVHAEYWIKNRLLDVMEFNAQTDKLYIKLTNGSEKGKKLTQITRQVQDALTAGNFNITFTGVTDKFLVQSEGVVFGMYKFKEDAQQGIGLIQKQVQILQYKGH